MVRLSRIPRDFHHSSTQCNMTFLFSISPCTSLSVCHLLSPVTFFTHPSLSCRLNFKDPEAVRALTCTLLKEDFGLSIEIPLERLIPTVPLRLNYIHWVEDLTGGQGSPRRGIDIGTHTSFNVLPHPWFSAPNCTQSF